MFYCGVILGDWIALKSTFVDN